MPILQNGKAPKMFITWSCVRPTPWTENTVHCQHATLQRTARCTTREKDFHVVVLPTRFGECGLVVSAVAQRTLPCSYTYMDELIQANKVYATIIREVVIGISTGDCRFFGMSVSETIFRASFVASICGLSVTNDMSTPENSRNFGRHIKRIIIAPCPCAPSSDMSVSVRLLLKHPPY